MKRILMAASAVGGVLTMFAATQAASAVPLAKPHASPQGLVEQAGRGGHGIGGGHGFGGGPSFHSGGGGHGPGGGGGARFHGGGPSFYSGGGHHGHDHGHHHHFRGFYGAPFVGYGAYYAYRDYGDDCRWLRRRALATGSPYWWDRYYACIED